MARPRGAPEGVIGVRPHDMKGKILHWQHCVHCGLVALRNEATRKRLKQGCWIWKDEVQQ